jgi:hypothetical protein
MVEIDQLAAKQTRLRNFRDILDLAPAQELVAPEAAQSRDNPEASQGVEARTPARKLRTHKETAAILSVTEAQLSTFVRHGEITYVAVGRGQQKMRKAFEDADIEKFLAARRRTEQWPKSPAPSNNGRFRRSSSTGLGSVDASFMSRLKQRRDATQNERSASTTSKPRRKPTP